jgi:hypothetical protein
MNGVQTNNVAIPISIMETLAIFTMLNDRLRSAKYSIAQLRNHATSISVSFPL